MQIGITERGDAARSLQWLSWVQEGKPAILITKDPLGLFYDLRSHAVNEGRLCNVIVHCGITGRGGTIVEPKVPATEGSLEGYQELIKLLGKDRVVLRLDPVFPSDKGFECTAKVVRQHEDTRIRLAFLHAYPHVKKRFRNAGLTPPPYDFYAPLEKRKEIHEKLEEIASKEIEVCGEPGFHCTGCISSKDCEILGITAVASNSKQRKHCACLAMKKELLSEKKQCPHNCLYCYWQ